MPSIGGDGQEKICGGSVLIHGNAPLCAAYLAAAGVKTLLFTSPPPALASHDPSLEVRAALPGDAADVVIDFGDGAAAKASHGSAVIRGGACGGLVVLGEEPGEGVPPDAATQALLETLAAAEALRALTGYAPRSYRYGEYCPT